MLLVAAQTIATALACYGLWRLLRSISGYGRAAALIVGLGFAARAILAQALFWISYLRLPLGRSLQLGPGFWFYGLDAEYYFHFAVDLSGHPQTLLNSSAMDVYPAPFFIRAFTIAIALCGPVPSVGILLNCAAYAGICFLIVRLGLRDGRIVPPALFALAAFSFSPAGVLWSSQPLKDTFFMFVVVVAIVSCFKWHDVWTSARKARSLVLPLAACAFGIIATVYALSSMRWYFGIVVWLSFVVLAIGTTLTTRWRAAALIANLVLFLLLPKIVLMGARTDLPLAFISMLDWTKKPMEIVSLPSNAARQLESAREGFESTPGATTISAGSATTTQQPSAPPAPDPEMAEMREEDLVPPEPEPAPPPIVNTPPPTTTATIASIVVPPSNETAAPPPTTTVAANEKPAAKARVSKRRRAPKPREPAPDVAVAPPVVRPVVPPKPAPAPPPVPASTRARLLTGSAATLIPRSLAQRAGLVRMGGGKGFWLFADLDTITFDIVLVFTIVYCTRKAFLRRGRLNASFLQLMAIFVMIAVSLVYAISNFGTLFRHRQMIYLTLLLLPVAMVRDEPREEPPPTIAEA